MTLNGYFRNFMAKEALLTKPTDFAELKAMVSDASYWSLKAIVDEIELSKASGALKEHIKFHSAGAKLMYGIEIFRCRLLNGRGPMYSVPHGYGISNSSYDFYIRLHEAMFLPDKKRTLSYLNNNSPDQRKVSEIFEKLLPHLNTAPDEFLTLLYEMEILASSIERRPVGSFVPKGYTSSYRAFYAAVFCSPVKKNDPNYQINLLDLSYECTRLAKHFTRKQLTLLIYEIEILTSTVEGRAVAPFVPEGYVSPNQDFYTSLHDAMKRRLPSDSETFNLDNVVRRFVNLFQESENIPEMMQDKALGIADTYKQEIKLFLKKDVERGRFWENNLCLSLQLYNYVSSSSSEALLKTLSQGNRYSASHGEKRLKALKGDLLFHRSQDLFYLVSQGFPYSQVIQDSFDRRHAAMADDICSYSRSFSGFNMRFPFFDGAAIREIYDIISYACSNARSELDSTLFSREEYWRDTLPFITILCDMVDNSVSLKTVFQDLGVLDNPTMVIGMHRKPFHKQFKILWNTIKENNLKKNNLSIEHPIVSAFIRRTIEYTQLNIISQWTKDPHEKYAIEQYLNEHRQNIADVIMSAMDRLKIHTTREESSYIKEFSFLNLDRGVGGGLLTLWLKILLNREEIQCKELEENSNNDPSNYIAQHRRLYNDLKTLQELPIKVVYEALMETLTAQVADKNFNPNAFLKSEWYRTLNKTEPNKPLPETALKNPKTSNNQVCLGYST